MNFKKKKGRYILILLLLTLVFFYVNKLTNTVSLQEDEFTISDEKEVAFSFVYDAVDVTELEESADDVSTEFYYDCEEAYRQVLTVQLLSSALNSPDDFHEVGEEDKAYDWCIGRLLTAFPFKSKKDFSSFIDALGDDYE